MSAPHFEMWLGDIGDNRPKYKLRIGEALHVPTPNTTVFFEKLTVENSGVPSKIIDWGLLVTLPDGERLKGVPLVGKQLYPDPGLQSETIYDSHESLFWKATVAPIRKGDPVSGFVEFIVIGTRQEVIREVGTDLEIIYKDDTGHENHAHQKVGAREWISMPPS